jgi:hypothetical protein
MENLEPEGGTSRKELLERVALMEAMIREGRRTTGRYGWIFVLWGLVDLAGIGLQQVLPHSRLVWPVVLACGFAMQAVGVAMLRRRGNPVSTTRRGRSVEAVWSMMGVALTLYVAAAMVRHVTWQISYVAAILMMIGMAHAISAMILRWRVQAMVAALWWAGGIALYFVPRPYPLVIFTLEMFVGMVLFGIYVMVRERRGGNGAGMCHA